MFWRIWDSGCMSAILKIYYTMFFGRKNRHPLSLKNKLTLAYFSVTFSIPHRVSFGQKHFICQAPEIYNSFPESWSHFGQPDQNTTSYQVLLGANKHCDKIGCVTPRLSRQVAKDWFHLNINFINKIDERPLSAGGWTRLGFVAQPPRAARFVSRLASGGLVLYLIKMYGGI